MGRLPDDEYLQRLGQSVVEWADLNFQSAIYVWRSSRPEQEVDIDEALQIAVSFERDLKESLALAGMSLSLLESRSQLVVVRNALAHSVLAQNPEGSARLWRPDWRSQEAGPLSVKTVVEFIGQVRALRNNVMKEEVNRFGKSSPTRQS